MYTVNPNEQALHGYFSRDLAPILTIKPGDAVRYSTLDAAWQAYDPQTDALKQNPLVDKDPLKGHALCGPIAIEGAQKGMVLEVVIGEIQVDKLGWNQGGGPREWALWEQLGVADEPNYYALWKLDADTGTGVSPTGHIVQLAPFMGVMGMPIDEPGQHSTAPPYYCGGNMDCKALVPGTRLFLPIPVDGGLFSVGDGHAAQGDGEVSGTAIECPMQQVDLTFYIHADRHLNIPRALTPEGWITLGFHEDLDEAMFTALNAMLELMMEQLNISRKEALSLASVVVDLRVTQVVNGVQGVHALLPDGALRQPK